MTRSCSAVQDVTGGALCAVPGVLLDKVQVHRTFRPVCFGLVWMILKFISLVVAKKYLTKRFTN